MYVFIPRSFKGFTVDITDLIVRLQLYFVGDFHS